MYWMQFSFILLLAHLRGAAFSSVRVHNPCTKAQSSLQRPRAPFWSVAPCCMSLPSLIPCLPVTLHVTLPRKYVLLNDNYFDNCYVCIILRFVLVGQPLTLYCEGVTWALGNLWMNFYKLVNYWRKLSADESMMKISVLHKMGKENWLHLN